ncbi:hypothetical protein SDC9_45673 [bioreactor metagenome]|uniref:Bro-N domain-containing protein n=1 Tax=bioreactor metagenome TaxID=1076179 RepID=A0A644W6Q4_9ZZZZ
MSNEIEIFRSSDNKIELKVKFDSDTVWLSQEQIIVLFERDQSVISRHINNIFKEKELDRKSNMQKMHIPFSDKPVAFYSLDVIISVGYRVKSLRGTQFRQWATARLKDYLVQGYAINEKRLQQKQQEVEFLKTGLRIVSRAIEQAADEQEQEVFRQFARGLALLDDYDHEALDKKGHTLKKTVYPGFDDYMELIRLMYSGFKSSVFAMPKDESFHSSINQIKQSFNGKELYPSIEEKAANLLYLITKTTPLLTATSESQPHAFYIF